EAFRDQSPVKGPPFAGPNCIMKMTDLGIAIGSAAKTASLHNLDNRIMYTAGVAGLSLGWMEGCSVAYGIPVSVTGKNIFFDRPVG
ncbi:MAG TPA: ferredoxin domain-containing protein, partial [Methanoregulaceae archaeon]|nr:ferredoxin domain-containing protein [Methanoregulaceae archaeon]